MEEVDTLTYEVVKHKIWQILAEGRSAMELVSGSPVVCEAKEAMYALYDEKGDTVASSAGILLHVLGSENLIKRIIELYSEEPGIYDGDVFFFNDPYIGGNHVPDQACIAPLFFEGNLMGWLAALFHTPEVGSLEVGGMCPRATEIFHEGIRLQGQKVMEKGKMRKDTYELLQRSVRDPVGITLDTRARVAGLNVGKERILELVDKYGLEKLRWIFNKMIIDSEKAARAKLEKLPDGKWRAVTYLDHDGQKYNLKKLSVTLIKKGDKLTIDFTGTDLQSPGAVNAALPGTYGHIFSALCSLLFWEEQWNRGILNAVEVIAPEGTMVNAKWPAAVGMSPAWPCLAVMNMLDVCISRMFVTVEKYYGDQNASWQTNTQYVFWVGPNQYGNIVGSILFDFLANGQGAGPTFDGNDTAVTQFTPEVQASDIEMYELTSPFIYLSRIQAPDSGGPGKYRGGAGLEIIYMVHKTPGIDVVVIGMGRKTSLGPGLYGGYEAMASQLAVIRNTDVYEWFKNKKIPTTYEDLLNLKGDPIPDCPPMLPSTHLKPGDIIYIAGGGGGGYGDPIERAPELVLKDVINQLTSMEYARDIYGVIIKPEASGIVRYANIRRKLRIDYEATVKRREEIREERRRRAK
jgi:N-methylhydantoinase B